MESPVNNGVGARVHAIIQGFRLTETLLSSAQIFPVALGLDSGRWGERARESHTRWPRNDTPHFCSSHWQEFWCLMPPSFLIILNLKRRDKCRRSKISEANKVFSGKQIIIAIMILCLETSYWVFILRLCDISTCSKSPVNVFHQNACDTFPHIC